MGWGAGRAMQLTEERDVLRGQLAAETKRADATGANPHINLPTSLGG